ncbi:preprotein translocase subunit SecA [Ezakiella coagulans]|uniref:Protein translocase subunit SecA n=1 Tax=Ezakiella coagulans TaxID=46507 RepID=A0A2U1E5Q6_9FIRM|nr:preprotein translocase subunit SecA [Ezakiella coagulans]PVY95261.1 preprotein translocase subunit SecA [Ezakiella coagulans]
MGLFEKIFGTPSAKELKKIEPIVDEVMSLEDKYKALSDEDLKNKTLEFKELLNGGKTLDDILPEAFAAIREADYRVLKMRPFRVQVIGGMVLHQGKIAEMKTGEGKTLVATLPAYLNALSGKGVHIVTVNDYLAKRDRNWMGKVFEFMGLKVGVIVNGMDNVERRDAYDADITYGTNNEFGFDYLRDNMVIYKGNMVQRGQNFAIVDEVDSILIDEARTPLIISGQSDKPTDLYEKAKAFASTATFRYLDPNEKPISPLDFDKDMPEETVDYVIDEKGNSVSLTELGTRDAEKFFGVENLADIDNIEIMHHINIALKAKALMKKDKDYVVKDGEVLIVDEFTGRIMYGRRYSDGLHQAIEAKEGLDVRNESMTLATITFQNYFRMYEKLSGMTGTAMTEESEFREIYDMEVIEIPTNKPVQRIDYDDEIYATIAGKDTAIVRDIKECFEKGQPVLVGTITIEDSEHLSRLLKKERIPHRVLNAKFHEKEAEIVAQAGRLGAVTIATNMAGRGTDIMLGGNPEHMAMNDIRREVEDETLLPNIEGHENTDDPALLAYRKKYHDLVEKYKEEIKEEKQKVMEAGGLHIIGTQRHESRRIDNQLRGRAGRQGDPGSSKFYISTEDDLMRLFGGEMLKNLIQKYGEGDDVPLKHKLITKRIETAQRNVEANNFRTRKHVLQYDDVMNQQRNIIYGERKKLLDEDNIKSQILDMIDSEIDFIVDSAAVDFDKTAEWNAPAAALELERVFGVVPKEADTPNAMKEEVKDLILDEYKRREDEFGEENIRNIERILLLRVVDEKWMDQIDAMDQLKTGIGLRAYGQKDPVQAYQIEGSQMFEDMNREIRSDFLRFLFHVEDPEKVEKKRMSKNIKEGASDKQQTIKRQAPKVGRNDPCPCGSGKKYKNCCGRNE